MSYGGKSVYRCDMYVCVLLCVCACGFMGEVHGCASHADEMKNVGV